MVKNKNKIYLKIVGFNIEVHFEKARWGYIKDKLENDLQDYYQGFISSKRPKRIDYKISISEKHNYEVIDKRRGKKTFINLYNYEKPNYIETFYHISRPQFHLIVRDILQKLLFKSEYFILHASANIYNGGAILFVASPRGGKSTVMALLDDEYKSLADDSVILKKEKSRYYVYQTPIVEKEQWVKKGAKRYNLGKIFFLRKDNLSKIEKLTNKDYIFQEFIKQVLAQDEKYGKRQVGYALKFVAQFDGFYRLYFAKDKKKLIQLFTRFN